MSQNFIIFATIELFALCLVLYFIIRANIYVNTLQHEVNELYFSFPVAIRDIKDDLKEFNRSLSEKMNASALSEQDIGFLAGKLSAELIFSRFNLFNPFRKKLVIVSLLFNLWKMREKLKATFLKLYLR
jgi:hypothetical protein